MFGAKRAAGSPSASNKQISEELQETLLQDPRVQQSLVNAGEAALKDPEVQRQIIEACKERFPEYAGEAKNQVKAWANDPHVQAKAKSMAKAAVQFIGSAGEQILKKIEQGPAGVRFLAFVASATSGGLAVMSLLNVLLIFSHLVLYMVSVYQLLFSLTTMLFEMNPDWVVTIEEKSRIPVSSYQDMLLVNARFLSLTGGRGLFYLFQGTLWLSFASFTELFKLAAGLFLLFVGLLHVLMHFGVAPKDVATKMREGYSKVRSSSNSPAPSGP